MEKKNETEKVKSGTNSGSTDDLTRRLSILKQKHRSPLAPADVNEEPADTTLAKQARRVSFASSNFVKQFTADPEKVTIWDTTYEEAVTHTVDSSSQSSNKSTQSSIQMELTLPPPAAQQQQQKARRSTIYFDGEDIEIDEEIFENLPPELAIDKENLLIRKRKFEEIEDGADVLHTTRANVSEMEFTQVIPKRREVVRQVVMYRDVEEITMMDSVGGEVEAGLGNVTNPVEEMEFTQCVPVEKIMTNNFMEKVNEEVKTVQDTVGVVSFEETACIGGILKATELNKTEEIIDVHLDETEKPVRDAVSVNFEEISRVIPAENTVPESTSMRLDFTACMNEDTQLLLNCDLSNNSKTRAHSEYSKIMMVRDYNPSPVNSKIMALGDLSSANYSEHHVTMNNLNIDDDSVRVDAITETSKNIREESFLNLTPMNGSDSSEIDLPVVETNFIIEAMGKLVDFKPKENVLKASDIKTWSLKMKNCNERITQSLRLITNSLLKQQEECKMHISELELSSLQSTREEEMEVEAASGFNTTEDTEQELSVMEQIQEKAKKSRHYWQITFKSESKCVVTTLYGLAISILDFDPTNGRVENIITNLRIKADAEPIAIYVIKHFDRKLSPELLTSSLGQNFDVLSFLDYVQMTFLHFVKLLDEHNELVKQYGFQMHENMRVTFTVINIELKLVWDVEVNFANEVLSENSVKVRARLGCVNERAVKKCIDGCPQGFAAFKVFASNVKDYMNSLKRSVRN